MTKNKKKVIIGLAIAMLTLMACNLTTLFEEPVPPSADITFPSQGTEFIVGDTVDITFTATGVNEIPFVELTLNSINGASLASYGSPDAQGATSLNQTLHWTPENAGDYELYLTAYDVSDKASTPAKLRITVFPRPTVIARGQVTLLNNQSFDPMTGQIGEANTGDIYVAYYESQKFAAWSTPDDGSFALLFEREGKNINELLSSIKVVRKLLSDSTRYSSFDSSLPMEAEKVYTFQRRQDPDQSVLFYLSAITESSITFEYAVVNVKK